MKSLGEIICHHGERYHQYTDDTQLYISAPSKLSNSSDVFQYLEAVKIWMGKNRFQMNHGKTERLWILGSSESWSLLSLELDGIALSQIDPVYNLRVLLDSHLLLKEQVTIVAREAFA